MQSILLTLVFLALLSFSFAKSPLAEIYPSGGSAPEGAAIVPSLEFWQGPRDEVLQSWLKVLGPFPPKIDLNPELLSEEDAGDHIRRMVRYTTEEGCRVEAFLLLPKKVRFPAPGALVFHSTSSNNILQPVGLADPPTRHLGLHLVRRGYVVLCPRNFIFGYGEKITMENLNRKRGREDFKRASEQLLKKHPEWTGMGKMVWDGMRALDYIETLPEVDSSRIITIGHSLGAKEALFLHAFDPRICGTISSEGGAGLALSNWQDIWYLGQQENDFKRDLHELMALGAPRPFMLIGGGSEDGVHSWPYLKAAAPAYAQHGKQENLVLLLHNDGHTIEPDQRECAFDWLENAIE